MESLSRVLQFILLLVCSTTAFSQDDNFLSSVIPPSPDASSLGKYGDIPVSLYSGTPNISIPLFTLEGRQLSLPISLSYHAGGFRVEEISSWVGLGWSLNAGGVITRSVRGIKDESSAGYSNLSAAQFNELTACHGTTTRSAARGIGDSEPDLFTFNVNGIAGKFFFKHDKTVVLETPQFHKLIPTFSSDDIVSWKLIGDDGTQYVFSSVEVTRTSVNGEPVFSNTAWYLTEIISSDKLEKIILEYSSTAQIDRTINFAFQDYISTSFSQGTACDIPVPLTCDPFTKSNYVVTAVFGKRLSRILTNKHEAIFAVNFSRLDLVNNNALSSIVINNRNNERLAGFNLTYDHFGSSGNYRLKLTQVQESGTSPSVVKPPYQFIYRESNGLPPRTSNAQDHWGFYNGKTSNSSLIPRMITTLNNSIMELSGGDRSPSTHHSLSNLISSIKYPTGGITTFEFEPHDFSYENVNPVVEKVYDDLEAHVSAIGAGSICEPLTATVLKKDTITLSDTQYVKLFGSLSRCDAGLGSLMPRVWIENASGTVLKLITLSKVASGETFDEILELPAGIYYLYARVNIATDAAEATAHFKLQKTGSAGITYVKSGGGARIKRIISSPDDGGNSLIKEYSYKLDVNPSGLSSGVLVTPPIYTHYQSFEKQLNCPNSTGEGSTMVYYTCPYFVRSSFSQLPMGTTSGSHVGYSRVVEKISGNGHTTYFYSTAREFPDFDSDEFPYATKTSNDWARGKLLKQETYVEDNLASPILRTENNYSSVYFQSIQGVKVRIPLPYTSPLVCACKTYKQISAISRLENSRSETINASGSVTQETAYEYDNITNSLPKRVTTTNSDGRTIVKTIKYSNDVNSISGLTANQIAALNQMVTANIISPPVETTETVANSPVSIVRNNFKIYPIVNPEFSAVTSMVGKESTQVALDGQNFITSEIISSYNNYGSPEIFESRDKIKHSLIWSGAEGKLLAHVENAEISNVAFSGFEDAGSKGGFVYNVNASIDKKTGLKSHILSSASISKSSLTSSKQYVVSFWARGGVPTVTNVISNSDALQAETDGWRYFEKIISGTSSVTISGGAGVLIDELRLCPVGSKMTTYNYFPGHQIHSTSDPNAIISFYQYDDSNRLKYITDHKGNLVKTFEYKYRQ